MKKNTLCSFITKLVILILYTANAKARKIIRDKEWHHIMIKASLFQVEIALNMSVNYVWQKLIELREQRNPLS